jgi:hypothetical protein
MLRCSRTATVISFLVRFKSISIESSDENRYKPICCLNLEGTLAARFDNPDARGIAIHAPFAGTIRCLLFMPVVIL